MRSHGTSSREVRSRDPAVVGEIPHLDRTPPPGPKYPASIIPNTLIIPHTSAYGKKSCSPPGVRAAPQIGPVRSTGRPNACTRLVASREPGRWQRSGTEGRMTLWLAEPSVRNTIALGIDSPTVGIDPRFSWSDQLINKLII